MELKPDWPKGYSRLGAAHHGLRSFAAAVAAYERGLALDPASDQLRAGLADARAAADEAARPPPRPPAGGGGDALGALFAAPDAAARLLANPKTAPFMAQPDFLATLATLAAAPSQAGRHLGDARVMQALGVLMGVDIHVPGGGGAGGSGGAWGGSDDAQMRDAEAATEAAAAAAEAAEAEEAKAARAAKAAAAAEKEKGNVAYKAKRLDEALGHYEAAIGLDGSDVSFRTNKAAVLFEQGCFAACAAECDAALEVAREQRADFKTVARALARKGSALAKLGDLEGAIAALAKSLTEHRTADTLAKLNAAEKALREKRQAECAGRGKGWGWLDERERRGWGERKGLR